MSPPRSSLGPDTGSSAARSPRLTGRLVAAQLAWWALVLLTACVFAANLVLTLGSLRVPCAGATCAPGQLSTAAADMLAGTLGLSLDAYAAWGVALALLPALVWFGVAGMLARRRPGDWLALLFALQLVVNGAGHEERIAQASNPLWHGAAWVVLALYRVLLFLSLALFPDGRFVPRWLVGVVPVFGVLAVVLPDTPLFPALVLLLTGAQIYRFRAVSGPVQRQQTKWVVASCAVIALWQSGVGAASAAIPALGLPGSLGQAALHALTPGVFALIPLAIGVAILRHRLWDIDALIHRALVYGILTACVVGIYVGAVAYLAGVFRPGNTPAITLLATGLVAALFQPLRAWLQRGVSRLVYGERDEPYAVLARLGRRLEGTLAPETVLPAIVETVATTLQLPYVAITLAADPCPADPPGTGHETVAADAGAIAAAYGSPGAPPLRLPLVYRGDPIGALLLTPRAGEALGARDRRLLADLARQAGVAASAVRLTLELQRARERLVATREEERRRLRRDLHDGLGPTLAALTLKIGAARNLLPRDPAAADAVLDALGGDIEQTVGEIRRLVADLRPPSLDELGLIGAIRACVARQACDGAADLRVIVDAPAAVPPLPAAVEVAAYRIAQEALANVVRHATARTCWVRVTLGEGLALEIRDDGVGLPVPHRPGVGLRSMHERAREVGGTCVVEADPAGGTRVLARLPVTHR